MINKQNVFPEKIQGAIFDVDDTLLDNQSAVELGTIHELTRLRAIHHAAEKYDLPTLATLTEQENFDAFLNASTHSMDGAVWEALYLKKIVDSRDLDPHSELLKEIVLLKNEIHADTLREYGRVVVHATELVVALADTFGIKDRMAIASSAIRRDINIFLDELTNLRQYFPDNRVVAHEDIPHGLGKPHPEPFDKAFATLDLPEDARKNVLAFEDDPRGVISAKKAGLFVCAITTRFAKDHPALLASEPDYIIDNYRDFIEQIRR